MMVTIFCSSALEEQKLSLLCVSAQFVLMTAYRDTWKNNSSDAEKESNIFITLDLCFAVSKEGFSLRHG
jgi:hypothetical protein